MKFAPPPLLQSSHCVAETCLWIDPSQPAVCTNATHHGAVADADVYGGC